MSEPPERSNLGRGLAALFGEEDADYAVLDRVRASKDVPIEHLHASPQQPRRRFNDDSVEELAESIRANGILQPILVRRHPERPAEYEIVAGERRWRAAQSARLHTVPVVIREVDDGLALELALVENLQREDLSALEEAEAYHHLMERFGHTQEGLGQSVGKSRSHIANTLRLRGLPESVKALLESGELSAGHARALLGAEDMEILARLAVDKHLNVRQVERLVQQGRRVKRDGQTGRKPRQSADGQIKDADTLALERDLSDLLGLKVSIALKGDGGALTIHYQTLEQLDDVLRRLNQAPGAAGV